MSICLIYIRILTKMSTLLFSLTTLEKKILYHLLKITNLQSIFYHHYLANNATTFLWVNVQSYTHKSGHLLSTMVFTTFYGHLKFSDLKIGPFKNWIFWKLDLLKIGPLKIGPFRNWIFWKLNLLKIGPFENWTFWKLDLMKIGPLENLTFWNIGPLKIGPFVATSF